MLKTFPARRIAASYARRLVLADQPDVRHGRDCAAFDLVSELKYTRPPVPPENLTEAPAEPRGAMYDDLGDRIAGVLHAAETAASETKADAEIEAASIRAEAETYSEEVREAVDSYANSVRREADEEARRAVAAGQAEARAMREAAQAMAGQLEEEARQRNASLREETRSLEDRRRRALDDLREIAATLQDIAVDSARRET